MIIYSQEKVRWTNSQSCVSTAAACQDQESLAFSTNVHSFGQQISCRADIKGGEEEKLVCLCLNNTGHQTDVDSDSFVLTLGSDKPTARKRKKRRNTSFTNQTMNFLRVETWVSVFLAPRTGPGISDIQ